MYVAAAAGGIWKTTNHGTFWKPIFEGQPDNTFGDLAIFAGDPRIIWAGTGEQNNRQSSSWGGGVYRSTDAGATWTYLGLHETRSIGRVVLHPTDPNIAYVAAVGNLWKPNAERGVYKTTDAGQTWTKILVRRHAHRRDRPRDGSARSERALRRDVSAPAQRVRLQRRRAGQRDLQDHRRRRDTGRSSRTEFPPATRAASRSRSRRRIRTCSSRSSSTRPKRAPTAPKTPARRGGR